MSWFIAGGGGGFVHSYFLQRFQSGVEASHPGRRDGTGKLFKSAAAKKPEGGLREEEMGGIGMCSPNGKSLTMTH